MLGASPKPKHLTEPFPKRTNGSKRYGWRSEAISDHEHALAFQVAPFGAKRYFPITVTLMKAEH